jgi:hypothetical protein
LWLSEKLQHKKHGGFKARKFLSFLEHTMSVVEMKSCSERIVKTAERASSIKGAFGFNKIALYAFF